MQPRFGMASAVGKAPARSRVPLEPSGGRPGADPAPDGWLRTLAETFELSDDAVLVLEGFPPAPGGRAILVNPAFTRMTGWTLADLTAGTGRPIAAEPAARELVSNLDRGLLEGRPFRTETLLRRRAGPPMRCSVSVTPVRDQRGELTRVLLMARDLHDDLGREEELTRLLTDARRRGEALEIARRAAEERSRTDVATGLAGRCHVLERLVAELERGRRERAPLGLALLRVDLEPGSSDGDGAPVAPVARGSSGPLATGALLEGARRLARAVRIYDLPGRWAEEVLAVLLVRIPDEAALISVAERVRRSLVDEAVWLGGGAPLRLRVSVGITGTFGDWPTAAGDVVDGAERALLAAVRSGSAVWFERPSPS